MMKSKIALAVILVFICNSKVYSQYLNTNPNVSLGTLIQNLKGPGIYIISPAGQFQQGCGIFTNSGIPQIPYANGVIMSTGSIDQNQLNDTASYTNSTDFGLPGDPSLNNVIAPFLTYDNQYLEFDFLAASDTVVLEAIFASEEYNEKVNQQTTDIFRFFLSGPGYVPNTNVSTIYGTQTPIGINTINNGQSVGTSTGPCINCNLFIDNVATGAVDLAFDGYTTPMVFKFRVNVCETYHMKISIADVFDGLKDSFILLKGSGFRTSGQLPILVNGNPVQPNDTIYICQGGTVTLSLPTGPSYSWSTGDTTQSITVSTPGIYSAAIFSTAPGSGCFAFTSNISVLQQGTIQSPVIVQNGNSLLAPNLLPSPGITYLWSIGGIPIPGATQSTFQIPGNGCYSLTIFEGTCESTSNIICITNTSIDEYTEHRLDIFPNPVTGTSVIETPFQANSVSTLRLLDIAGKEVLTPMQQKGNLLTIDKAHLLPGVYFLEISNSDYQGTIRKKIVFQ